MWKKSKTGICFNSKLNGFSKGTGSQPGAFFELADEVIDLVVAGLGGDVVYGEFGRGKQKLGLFELGIDHFGHAGEAEGFFVADLKIRRGQVCHRG